MWWTVYPNARERGKPHQQLPQLDGLDGDGIQERHDQTWAPVAQGLISTLEPARQAIG